MSSKRNSWHGLGTIVLVALVVVACAHQASPSTQIQNGLSPFSSARNQAVALVGYTKRSLHAADVNTLAVAYTALEEKANAYASFMAEAVMTSSFDPNKNSQYATDLSKAIASFDQAFAPLAPTKQSTIAGAWVPGFAQSLQAHWDQYNGLLARMSPQTKADLLAQLKRDTVWPNYEDIATESVVGIH
jgi:hypothetical protein